MVRLVPLTSVSTTLPSSPPETTTASPTAVANMAPPWTATLLGSPRGGASTMASSPSTKTAMRPRKCAAITAPPAATGWMRSTTEAVSVRVSVMGRGRRCKTPPPCGEGQGWGSGGDGLLLTQSQYFRPRVHTTSRPPPRPPHKGEGEDWRRLCDAALKPFGDQLARQIAADEDDTAVALLAVFPWPLVVAVSVKIQALEHKARIVVLEGEDAFAAQNVRAFLLHQVLHPREELVRIERLVASQRNRLHVLVVIVLEPAVRMRVLGVMVMMVVVAMIMIVVMMIVTVAFEKFRLDVEDAVEIEGVALQHFAQRDLGALGLVHPRVWIDAADARLDFGQLLGRHQVGLIDQDHVGKRDLVLGFRRVLQAVVEPFGVGDGHHRVELGAPSDVLVDEEGLRDGSRVGEASGLDDDGVELAFAFHQPVEDAHQVAAHGAADAAVVHLEHFLVGADHELVVDADLAEFIDDDGVFLAVRLGQDAVEERGLAGAEIAGEHGHGNLVGH